MTTVFRTKVPAALELAIVVRARDVRGLVRQIMKQERVAGVDWHECDELEHKPQLQDGRALEQFPGGGNEKPVD